ncbi:MAG TPA: transcriptional repressor [Jatrophihabitans sp.]|jgi:Fur family ferric uptake transcriptional regulator
MSTHTHAHATARVPEQPPDLARRLRSRGLRMTAQREQVLDAVRSLGHATPEQISDAVSDVDVATVYRTLELLEELDLVRHTHLGHGAPSYRPSEDDHLHVVCHSCGRVVEVPHDVEHAVDDLDAALVKANGFSIDRSHFTVFGTCADCAQRSGTHVTGNKAAPGKR